MADRIHPADYYRTGTGPVVRRFPYENPWEAVFQGDHLSAEPDHGLCFCHAVFHHVSTSGPINSILLSLGWIREPIDFMGSVMGTRLLIGLMNFLMWFGNTTIMLMAAIMGISPDIFEASELDGCNRTQKFFYVTLPLIRPILAYTLIISIIGGLQMFDVPQILTNGQGTPDRTSMTLIMFLNSHLKSKNYGMAGALSVYLFIVSAVLCFVVYRILNTDKGQ